MTEINNNQEQTQNEIRYQTITDFLESTPPNQLVHISDLSLWQNVGQYPGNLRNVINTPPIRLHCLHQSCDGLRFFRCTYVSNDGKCLEEDFPRNFYATYQCSNCQVTNRVYSLSAKVHSNREPEGVCYKFGEFPPFGPYVPSKLIELIGPDRDIFLKGRRCESQGLGIGAFVYYRRVVENQKNRILEKIIEVSERISAPQAKIDTLREAMGETQFSKALEMARDVIPESLLIDGHNPILLLHRALSRGVHELSDVECLDFARSVRVVLSELSGRMSSVLKDEVEFKEALSTLMKKNRITTGSNKKGSQIHD